MSAIHSIAVSWNDPDNPREKLAAFHRFSLAATSALTYTKDEFHEIHDQCVCKFGPSNPLSVILPDWHLSYEYQGYTRSRVTFITNDPAMHAEFTLIWG
jgi:hypothetical protein